MKKYIGLEDMGNVNCSRVCLWNRWKSLIPGHEWSGIVEEAGSGEDRHWIGKRVVGSNDVVCLKCDACRSGNWRYCKEFEEIGFKRNGAYAEYVQVPAYGLCEFPENISFQHGALCEPLGVALGTLEKAGAKFGDTCLIIGAGSIGLCMLAAAAILYDGETAWREVQKENTPG